MDKDNSFDTPISSSSHGGSVAMIFVWRSPGHVNALLGLARQFQRLGHSVVFSGPEEIRVEVERQGHRYYAVPHIEWIRMPFGIRRRPFEILRRRPLLKAIREARLAARKEVTQFKSEMHKIVESTKGVIREVKPSFVVFDPFLLLYAIPFMAHSLPVIAISTKVLACPDPIVPPYTETALPPRSLSSRVTLKMIWWKAAAHYCVWELYERLFSGGSLQGLAVMLAQECGISIIGDWKPRPLLTDCKLSSIPEWVLHAREFDFPRAHPLKQNVKYVGPCVDFQRTELLIDNHEDEGHGPLVVCVMSTVVHPGTVAARRRARFLNELLVCMEKNTDLLFILATGNEHEDVLRGRALPNVRVFQHIPTLQFLQKASLLITQGGANIVKEAILSGVPMLVFPGHGDQPGMSARIVFHGLGKRANAEGTSAVEISSLIREVLNDESIRTAVGRMRCFFQNDESSRIAELLGELGVVSPLQIKA